MKNYIDINDSKTLAEEAVKLLLEKQGLEIKLYDMREKEAITDFYVNVTGKSAMHTNSLADDLYDKLAELGRSALRIEGRGSESWVLVDYGDLIVNIFDKKSRDFYDLDRLLPAGTAVDIEHLVKEVDEKFSI
jgi:ribosome-associated protein